MKQKSLEIVAAVGLGALVAGCALVARCRSTPEPLKIEGEARFYAEEVTICKYVKEHGPCGFYIYSSAEVTTGCFNVPSITSSNRWCITVSSIPESYETTPEVLSVVSFDRGRSLLNPIFSEEKSKLLKERGQAVFMDACRKMQCIEHYQSWQEFIKQRKN